MKLNARAVTALSDALSHIHSGLERGRAGWAGTKTPVGQYHHFRTINALIEAGYLQLYCKGIVAHITGAGQEKLRSVREEVAA